jgi:hypothetical protein
MKESTLLKLSGCPIALGEVTDNFPRQEDHDHVVPRNRSTRATNHDFAPWQQLRCGTGSARLTGFTSRQRPIFLDGPRQPAEFAEKRQPEVANAEILSHPLDAAVRPTDAS